MTDAGMIHEGITPGRRGALDMFKIDPNVTSEIKPHRLVEVAGKTGPFYVARAGTNRMFRECYFYGDERIQFFFYAVWEQPDSGGRIIIHHATTHRMEGPRPKLVAGDLERIEANLTQLFTERQYYAPGRPVDSTLPRTIEFTWGLRR